MKDNHRVIHQLLVTNRNEKEVFELLEHFEPGLGVLRLVDGVLVVADAEHEDLHVFL